MALARLGMMFDIMNRLIHGRTYDYTESARLMDRVSLHLSKYWQYSLEIIVLTCTLYWYRILNRILYKILTILRV